MGGGGSHEWARVQTSFFPSPILGQAWGHPRLWVSACAPPPPIMAPPIGAAKGKQSDTEALCQTPPIPDAWRGCGREWHEGRGPQPLQGPGWRCTAPEGCGLGHRRRGRRAVHRPLDGDMRLFVCLDCTRVGLKGGSVAGRNACFGGGRSGNGGPPAAGYAPTVAAAGQWPKPTGIPPNGCAGARSDMPLASGRGTGSQ